MAAVLGNAQSLGETLTSTFSMIVVSELGDKTFFIAALLAMRHQRLAVLLGAAGALVSMTALSVTIGVMLPALLPREYAHWAAVLLFVYFGGKLLMETAAMFRNGEGVGPNEELEEVERELKEGTEKTALSKGKFKSASAVIFQAFVLTFMAEWGDRSQISTIAMAAARSPLGVMLGGAAGHCLCTSLAVLGGKYLATSISERVVLGTGGVLFLAFALHGAVTGAAD